MSPDEEIRALIAKHRSRVTVAAHHYQRPEIVKYADSVGDSYRLAVDCASGSADFIVMCGVLFMAESAAVMAGGRQRVFIPDRSAGCPMADMIDERQLLKALDCIRDACGKDAVPVVYMNSTAAVKAVCGRAGGSVCTSSNAEKILRHFLKTGAPVFFAPDSRLGYNTAVRCGVSPEDGIARIGADMKIDGGARKAKVFLWDGYCPVHNRFTEDQVKAIRREHPGISVIVHPECNYEVVHSADGFGSTEFLLRTVKEAAPGTVWGVGTESSFVERLSSDCPDKTVLPLASYPCADMNKITPEKLAAVLREIDGIIRGGTSAVNEVTVDPQTAADARKALERMVSVTEANV